MKSIEITKFNKVENTDTQLKKEGIVAFQMVKFIINYFGKTIETIHDTKILSNGKQIVIGGCGYINEGYEI